MLWLESLGTYYPGIVLVSYYGIYLPCVNFGTCMQGINRAVVVNIRVFVWVEL